MDLEELWERALSGTEILRTRVSPLSSIESTIIDYIFLAESVINIGDTVVRRGKVWVHRPLILLPREFPQFEGFEFENIGANPEKVGSFLLMRGVQFPSLKYSHSTSSLEIYEGSLKEAIREFLDQLERAEDVKVGLIKGLEDCWQFSVLIYIASLVVKSAHRDIQRVLENLKKRREGG
jgi:hypothetical protein